MSDSETVIEVLPEKKTLPLQGLYLGEGLAALAEKAGRPLVITGFVTDKDGIVAQADEHHKLRVPSAIANASDWRLFQELMAQADVIITTGSYLRRAAASSFHTQDILYQFQPGGEFEQLGEWRLKAGYKKRSPDVAVVTRSLDFQLPDAIRRDGRRAIIFTTDARADDERARELTASGAIVIRGGEAGVEGNWMIDALADGHGYRVIMMAAGPSILYVLIQADRLDRLYVTQVQVQIPFQDPSTVRTILPEGQKVGELRAFGLRRVYRQEEATTADGSVVPQLFLRYDKSTS